ncbi:MAG: hypothetical protein KH054_08985, partial [Firmicutes bacterium]|nr:hypothetical protein [Bacillota bacterium]
MKAILKVYLGEQWREYVAYNRVTADFRLDEQLDTGNIMIITDSAEPISPMSAANLELTDGDNSVYFPCYCFDRVEVWLLVRERAKRRGGKELFCAEFGFRGRGSIDAG